MYVIRVDRARDRDQPIALWLRSASPVKYGEREQALRFQTKVEAHRAAADAKLVGWTLEDA
jgi:hypothetical protein